MNGPTLAKVRDLLLDLGFVDHSVAGRFHRFEFPLPDTLVLLPPYGDAEAVSPGNLFGVQTLLDHRGLMTPADFTEALRDRSLAG